MKKYYLAYGSNLNLQQLKKRCPTAKFIGKTILNNYRLVFKGNNIGFLTIEEVENSIVPLGIFEITEFDEHNLDWYEGYPNFYYKEYLDIIVNDNKEKALIYIMNPNYSYALPSIEYLKNCIEGYNDFGFNKKILEQAIETSYISIEKKLIR